MARAATFCVALIALALVFAQDPSYDHQTKTYTSQFQPISLAGNMQIMPFFSPDHSLDTQIDLINSATSTIDIYQPGFSSWSGCTPYEGDCVGCTIDGQRNESFPIFPALLNAAHRGVAIRLITNNYNTPTCNGKIAPLDYLALNDIQIRYYTTTTFMHSKYMSVDGKKAAICSINYTQTSFFKNREAGVVLGQGTDTMQQFATSVFNFDWAQATPYHVNNTYSAADMHEIQSRDLYTVPNPQPPYIPGAYVTPKPTWLSGNMQTQIFASPDFAYKLVAQDAQTAQKTFAMEIYQITEPDLCNAVQDMYKRGVAVNLLVSSRIYDETDWKAAQVCYKQLYEAGLKFRKTPSYYTYSHQKFWIVDGTLLGLSTGNWSPSDYPEQSSFPPFGQTGWMATNRDLNVHISNADVVANFMNVLTNDSQRGEEWHPFSGVELMMQ
eukprot:TRINITY_DN34_c0_g1_i1.p1 TRINITY_DN34_c0_g1~~TRINITY_DN34_c0_g1_i1.p1  ORF type:complete len:452 (-),score=78.97 TRINITY_DN34_c0_g1_i1:26-1342(-)